MGYISDISEVRERGIPERIMRTALGAMMGGDPQHDGFRLLLLLSRTVPRPSKSNGWSPYDLRSSTEVDMSSRRLGQGVSSRTRRSWKFRVGKSFTRHKKNSAQTRPFSTKICPAYTKFRGAARGATPEAVAHVWLFQLFYCFWYFLIWWVVFLIFWVCLMFLFLKIFAVLSFFDF